MLIQCRRQAEPEQEGGRSRCERPTVRRVAADAGRAFARISPARRWHTGSSVKYGARRRRAVKLGVPVSECAGEGIGIRRSPSPEEKQRQAITPVKRIVRAPPGLYVR